ncbi:ABC transporter substrate-binding protein [Sphaerimonospora sp. CA-214678]|uniref:ABC transporter substrate-binding protein n=1 Tax=Sphaerimonospora sp. CA-214678 TaxID=3240029 RepID=UPI003D8C4282
MMMRRIFGAAAAVLATALALSGCGGGDPLSAPATSAPAASEGTAGPVVVGSFDFPESVLLASIYAQGLRAKGVTVEEKPNIGSREVVYDQIKSGGLTVLPEYVGSLLAFVDKNSTARTKEEIVAELKAKLSEGLQLLAPSAAEDNNSLSVTRETADKHGLATMEDLAKVSEDFVVGGPPEFKQRQQENLKSVYGIEFKEWKPTGATTADAIKSGTIQVGNVFTTDPKIVLNDLVPLQDTKNAFGAENIAPLVYTAGVDATVTSTLDAISIKLDTATLVSLMKRIAVDKEDPPAVAADWLTQNGLV